VSSCYCVRTETFFNEATGLTLEGLTTLVCPRASCPHGYVRNTTDCRCEPKYECADGSRVDRKSKCPFKCKDGSFVQYEEWCPIKCLNGSYVTYDFECEEYIPEPELDDVCTFYPSCENTNFIRDPNQNCDCVCDRLCPKPFILTDDCECNLCSKKCDRTEKLNKNTCECEQRSPRECNIKCKNGFSLNREECRCECDKVCEGNTVLVPNTCKCRHASRETARERGPWTAN